MPSRRCSGREWAGAGIASAGSFSAALARWASARASGPGSRTHSERQAKKALGAFHTDLRLPVSTSILEEGIDVPQCDAVNDGAHGCGRDAAT